MKRFFRIRLAVCGALLIAGIVAVAIGLNAGVDSKKVRVIYTNDTLGYLESCG